MNWGKFGGFTISTYLNTEQPHIVLRELEDDSILVCDPSVLEEIEYYMMAQKLANSIGSFFGKQPSAVTREVAVKEVIQKRLADASTRSDEVKLLKHQSLHFPAPTILEGAKVYNEYHGRRCSEEDVRFTIFDKEDKTVDVVEYPVSKLLDNQDVPKFRA